MCGFAAYAPFTCVPDEEIRARVHRMTDALRHRGPDDHGLWMDAEARICLGFRRLSILDLSPAGHQPMVSASGRYAIVFNGEIYNFRDLRAELEASGDAPLWRGHSDTEAVLAVVDRFGPQNAIPRLLGMFAMAIWDRSERALWLARDRLGKKPLYYGSTSQGLLIASELKAFYQVPEFAPRIDRSALKAFMRLGYIPSPRTIFEGFSKLPAGHILRIDIEQLRRKSTVPSPSLYWSIADIAVAGQASLREGNAATQEEFEALLDDATRRRLVADVELGAFLSGGIDSSLVVARMVALSDRPPRTFSIGFTEDRWNEAHHACRIAAHLGTDHTELLVTPEETLAVVPELGLIYDEPFADPSMIPTLLVCRLARRHVTVALSGDGGDEFFGGYDRYWRSLRIASFATRIPQLLRATARPPLRLLRAAAASLDVSARNRRRLDFALALSGEKPMRDFYRGIMSLTSDINELVPDTEEAVSPLMNDHAWIGDLDDCHQLMLVDARGYLIDDILVKVDRASMSTSLEVRSPLLDHRLVELAWRMPGAAKIHGGRGKLPLRHALSRQVPPELFERPKMGFGVPIEEWLRGQLRDWAESLLDGAMLRRQGHLSEPVVTRMWRHYLQNTEGWSHVIWCILMFQAWLDYFDKRGT